MVKGLGKPWKQWTQFILTFIVLLAFFARAFNLDFQSAWSDELDVLRISSAPLKNLWAYFGTPGWNGPLFYVIVKGWLSLFNSSSLFILRYLSVITSLIAIGLGYQLAKVLTNKFVAFWVLLITGISPYLVWYAQDGKMYSLYFLLSLASTLLIIRAVNKGRWFYWVLYAIFTVSGLYAHLLFSLLLPIHLIIFLYSKRIKRNFAIATLVVVVIIAVYLPQLRWEIPAWFSDFTTGHYAVSLAKIVQTQIYVYAVGFPTFLDILSAVLGIGLFLFGLWQLNSLSKQHRIYILSYLILPVILLFFISLGMPIYTDRYLIPVSFPFYLLCALGIQNIWTSNRPISSIAVIIYLIVWTTTIFQQSTTPVKGQF